MAYADDMAALERRRQLAQALMQQGFQAQPAQQSGRFVVGPTAMSTLGRLGSLALGNIADKRIAKDEQAATDAERDRLAQALMGMSGGAPKSPDTAQTFPLADNGEGTAPTAPGSAPAQPSTAPSMDPRRQAAIAALRQMPLSALQQATQAQAMDQFKPPERVDLGDAIGLVKNGQVVGRIPKGNSPDAVLGSKTTMRGQDMTASTAANGQKVTMRGQDIGAATAIRGQNIGAQTAAAGRATTERGQDLNYGIRDKALAAAQAKANQSNDSALQQQATMIANTQSALNDALAKTSMKTTGMIGAATRGNSITHGAGSDALALENQIKTIQANLSFDALNQMRQASKTGGALGSITEKELDLLGSTVANLDPNMKASDLRHQLQKIQQHLDNLAQLNAAIQQQRAAGVQTPVGQDAAMQAAGDPGGIDADMAAYGGM